MAEYKLRPADSQKEVELVRSLGVEFRLSVEIGGELRVRELEEQFDILFLGVGLGPTEPLRIPGENLPGVMDALHFIAGYKTHRGAGVGRRVVVIGGGNTAIDAATAALRLGAEQVHMLYRRSETEMPAYQFEYELARREGVRFHWLTQPVAIHGKDAVEYVECVRMELGPAGPQGTPPAPAGSRTRIIDWTATWSFPPSGNPGCSTFYRSSAAFNSRPAAWWWTPPPAKPAIRGILPAATV